MKAIAKLLPDPNIAFTLKKRNGGQMEAHEQKLFAVTQDIKPGGVV